MPRSRLRAVQGLNSNQFLLKLLLEWEKNENKKRGQGWTIF